MTFWACAIWRWLSRRAKGHHFQMIINRTWSNAWRSSVKSVARPWFSLRSTTWKSFFSLHLDMGSKAGAPTWVSGWVRPTTVRTRESPNLQPGARRASTCSLCVASVSNWPFSLMHPAVWILLTTTVYEALRPSQVSLPRGWTTNRLSPSLVCGNFSLHALMQS